MRTKFLTAPGQGFRSAREVQALAGLSDVYAVYQAVARGKPVGGEAWRWADEDELPIELRYGTRNRYVTDDPAAAAKAANDENGEGHNGDDAEPPPPPAAAAAVRKAGPWGMAKRLLVCRCAACAGRVWKPRDVHRLPEISGRVVRPDTLPGINRLTGHDFEYLETAPVGEWRKRTAAERDGVSDAFAPPPMTPAERRAAHVFACDPAARELQQVNPLGPGSDRANGGTGVR